MWGANIIQNSISLSILIVNLVHMNNLYYYTNFYSLLFYSFINLLIISKRYLLFNLFFVIFEDVKAVGEKEIVTVI